MNAQHVIYVTADVYEAATRLLKYEAETLRWRTAIKYAGQLMVAHSVAGMDKESAFWRKVWLYLLTLEITDEPLFIGIIKS